ncbi:6251_t:CDS:1, partial [Acaulospora colombiana]
MSVANEMVVTPARVLPTPVINYHVSSKEAMFTPRNGLWNLRNKKVTAGGTLSSWSVIAFGNERDCPHQAIKSFIRELVNICSDAGMNILTRDPPIIHENPAGNIEESMTKAFIRAGQLSKQKPQLVLCILPYNSRQIYDAIKLASDTILGVATQCVLRKHVFSAKKQCCANICLKINAKLGGMNSFIRPDLVPFITERPSIIMGAVVTYSSPYNTKTSIAALCASLDIRASRYASTIRVQRPREEMISDLSGMVKDMILAFYQ